MAKIPLEHRLYIAFGTYVKIDKFMLYMYVYVYVYVYTHCWERVM